MSADNGIYIGHFADGEYRVIHAQAIDNLWYPSDKENAAAIVDYYRDAPSFMNTDEAYAAAYKMEYEILNDDFCPILEYGISVFNFEKPFAEYEKEAKETYDDFYSAPEM